jgi:hypothetical protein
LRSLRIIGQLRPGFISTSAERRKTWVTRLNSPSFRPRLPFLPIFIDEAL